MKTKIDERRDREAYDLAHPWQPMASAIINDGRVCELLFNSLVGPVDGGIGRFFLAEDDQWYGIDPPTKVSRAPMNWRPTNTKLTPARRAEIANIAWARPW
jgi:hypothetical protein